MIFGDRAVGEVEVDSLLADMLSEPSLSNYFHVGPPVTCESEWLD